MKAHQWLLRLFNEHLEVVKYLVAGGYNTAFGFGVFAGLYYLCAGYLHYLMIAVIAQVVAITNAFLVYRFLVFKSTGNILHEYVKVYLVYGASFLITLVLLALLVEILALHPVLAQFFVTVVTVVVSYLGHSRFTFRGRSAGGGDHSPG